jgi:anaerobic selenocysteine-containing dehydrogenase
VARISSRRGSVTAPVHVDQILRKGLAFMTLHFPEQVETNILTLDAWDPKSGTAEFKATAIRVEKAADADASDAPAGTASTAEVAT